MKTFREYLTEKNTLFPSTTLLDPDADMFFNKENPKDLVKDYIEPSNYKPSHNLNKQKMVKIVKQILDNIVKNNRFDMLKQGLSKERINEYLNLIKETTPEEYEKYKEISETVLDMKKHPEKYKDKKINYENTLPKNTGKTIEDADKAMREMSKMMIRPSKAKQANENSLKENLDLIKKYYPEKYDEYYKVYQNILAFKKNRRGSKAFREALDNI